MNKSQVEEFTQVINQNVKFQDRLNEFVAGVDANVMFMVQAMQKMQSDVELTKRHAIVAAKKGTEWDISGYVYGRTSNDDPYVLLYPSHPKMVHKVTRVYDHQFYELPHFIPTNNIPTDAPDDNPTKDKAAKKGIYHECDLFTIATVDGKETNMGPEQRFFMTVEIPGDNFPAAAPPALPELKQTDNSIKFSPDIKVKDESIESKPITETNSEADAIKPTEETIAVTELNSLLGLGEPDPEPQAPYLYSDGSEVANDENLIAIYLAYWQQNKKIVANGLTLQSWYKRNAHHLDEKELI